MDAGWPEASAALVGWYRRHRRALPWRGADAYGVLVSEFMLQQTRVDTVLPYYRRFLQRFPTLETLAAASEAEVLAEWEGLGYYRRARHLLAAARIVVQEHGGRLPDDPALLRQLPGIGPYTAAALASIVHGRRVPALDGNVLRVMARVLAVEDSSDRGGVRSSLGRAVEAIMGQEDPGEINQALMELGATVCRPRAPSCDRCPLGRVCRARRAGDPERFPVRRQRRPLPSELRAAALLVVPGRGAVVRRRGDRGLLAGLWELPSVVGHGTAAAQELAGLLAAAGFPAVPEQVADRRQWQFSHLRWDIELWRFRPVGGGAAQVEAGSPSTLAETPPAAEDSGGEAADAPGELEAVPPERLSGLPMPALMRRWLDTFLDIPGSVS